MEIPINKILNRDCLEYMRELPNNYFDLIITDPPYGIKRNKMTMGCGVARYIDYGDYDWDDDIPSQEIFQEMLRVSKNQIIFGGNYMTEYLPSSSCWIVWDKDNVGNDFADCELAWTSFNKAVRKFKWKWNGMLQREWNGKRKDCTPLKSQFLLEDGF